MVLPVAKQRKRISPVEGPCVSLSDVTTRAGRQAEVSAADARRGLAQGS